MKEVDLQSEEIVRCTKGRFWATHRLEQGSWAQGGGNGAPSSFSLSLFLRVQLNAPPGSNYSFETN